MKPAVVVPTCRPDRIAEWKAAWLPQIEAVGASLYIVHDEPSTWADMPDIFSRRTDGIRCWGFLQALRDGADLIITLDDDVMPGSIGNQLEQHITNLTTPAIQQAWQEVVPMRTRGIPFRQQQRTIPCAISHGLWLGTPDLDAPTQLLHPELHLFDKPEYNIVLDRGRYAPLSAMNLAFTREIAPAFFFPPMGEGQPYDRFGDIWAGIVAKRICDHLGLAVRSGAPWVRHDRASDPFQNLIKEAAGTQANEEFWQAVDGITFNTPSVFFCVVDLAQQLQNTDDPYYRLYGEYLLRWLSMLA